MLNIHESPVLSNAPGANVFTTMIDTGYRLVSCDGRAKYHFPAAGAFDHRPNRGSCVVRVDLTVLYYIFFFREIPSPGAPTSWSWLKIGSNENRTELRRREFLGCGYWMSAV